MRPKSSVMGRVSHFDWWKISVVLSVSFFCFFSWISYLFCVGEEKDAHIH